jgi:ankyrin repeat protein
MSKDRAYQYFQSTIKTNNAELLRSGISRAKELGIWDIEERIDESGEAITLTHLAAQYSAESIEVLRLEGANLDARSSTGETPLMKAAKQGNHISALKLLDLGANPSLDLDRKTVFDFALESDRGERVAIELLSRGIDRFATADRLSNLRKALDTNKVELSAILISRVEDVFSPEEEGGIFRKSVEKLFTPSVRFPIDTIRSMFKKYIGSKIESDATNRNFWEVVRDISDQNNEALQQKIISGSIRTDATIKCGFSLVTFAAIFNNEGAFFNREISMPLIDWSRADIDYRDILGHTPAEWASQAEDRGMLEALAEMGADVRSVEIDASWMEEAVASSASAAAAHEPTAAEVVVEDHRSSESGVEGDRRETPEMEADVRGVEIDASWMEEAVASSADAIASDTYAGASEYKGGDEEDSAAATPAEIDRARVEEEGLSAVQDVASSASAAAAHEPTAAEVVVEDHRSSESGEEGDRREVPEVRQEVASSIAHGAAAYTLPQEQLNYGDPEAGVNAPLIGDQAENSGGCCCSCCIM